jgi:hypothetical protein
MAHQNDFEGSKKVIREFASVIGTNGKLRLFYELHSNIQHGDSTKIIQSFEKLKTLNINDIESLGKFLRVGFKLKPINESEIEKYIFSALKSSKQLDENVLKKLIQTSSTTVLNELNLFNESNFIKFAIKKFNARYANVMTEEELALFKLLYENDKKKLIKYQKTVYASVLSYLKILENRQEADPLLIENVRKIINTFQSQSLTKSILNLVELQNQLYGAIDE